MRTALRSDENHPRVAGGTSHFLRIDATPEAPSSKYPLASMFNGIEVDVRKVGLDMIRVEAGSIKPGVEAKQVALDSF